MNEKTLRFHAGAALALTLFAATMAPTAHAAPGAPSYSDAPYAQTQLIHPPNAHDSMRFGAAMAVSGDTLVIGAPFEAGSVTSTLASPNTLCTWCGAVYIYERQGGEWVLTDYLKAYNAEKFDRFGNSVAIEGDMLLVGAPNEDSLPGASYTQTLVSDNTGGDNIGAVYVYTRSAGVWNFAQLVKPTGAEASPTFGRVSALRGDTFVTGASDENYQRGAVYVFAHNGITWTQQARLVLPSRTMNDSFGGDVALDGDTLAVAAPGVDSYAGAVYIYTRSGISWTQQVSLTAFNAASGGGFAEYIDLHDGTLAVGATSEDGSMTSTVASPNALGADDGAVYVYTGSGANWTLQAYLKSFNWSEEMQFGTVSVQSDTLLVGAIQEDGSITSTQASPNLDTPHAGAAYVYRRTGSTWNLQQYLKASRPHDSDNYGWSVLLHDDWAFVGALNDADANAWCDAQDAGSGSVYFYRLGLPAATLSGLSLAGAVAVTNEVQSQPWFQNYYGCYDALLPAAPNTVTVDYTTTAAGAAVQVAVSSTTNPAFQACPAGVCPVDVGDNVIKVSVTATGTVDTRDYVIRALRPPPSSDAALSGLSLDPPGALVPAFVSNTTNYTAAVPNAAAAVTVTAATNDAGASVAYAAAPGSCTNDVCTLNVGLNTLTVTVTAADGATQEYVVEIMREASPPPPSNDAALAALTLSPVTLNPAFVSSTLRYTAAVPNSVDVVTAAAATNDAGASVAYAAAPGSCTNPPQRGATPPLGAPCTLEVGANTITTTVTAADGATKREYVVDVTRQAGAVSIGNVWPRTGEPAGGMPVAIFGAGFTGALAVTVDGVSVPFTVTGDGRINLVMPPGTGGAYADFEVTAPSGTARADDAFRYVAPLTIEFDGEQGAVFTTTDGITVTAPPQGAAGTFSITITPLAPEAGLPGDVLMHSFRLDALWNGVPIEVLSRPITIQLPVDVNIVPAGKRPWLYVWVANDGLAESHGGRPSSVVGRWSLVPGQIYDAASGSVTVALRPMERYALSTVRIHSYWLPIAPVQR